MQVYESEYYTLSYDKESFVFVDKQNGELIVKIFRKRY